VKGEPSNPFLPNLPKKAHGPSHLKILATPLPMSIKIVYYLFCLFINIFNERALYNNNYNNYQK
jgi:hypothetical protein